MSRHVRNAGVPEALPEVDSLQRGLQMLRSFRNSEKSLRLADFVERTRIPRQSAQKLLNTLVAHHFLRYLPEFDRYEPEVACFVVGHALRASLTVLRVARQPMQRLAAEMGVDVFLAVREGLEMMVLEYCSVEPAQYSAGSLLPLAHSAAGRAWLWSQKPTVQGEYIERLRATEQEDALDALPGIYRAFQDLSERGYCISLGEELQDKHAIATPLLDPADKEALVLAAMTTGQRLREPPVREAIGTALVACAARIRSELARVEAA
ncbi:MAG: helix-turn-helix domain-containing protein [Burkholderiaceae bacterium]|nr:helix-turn-helix domain-containing protein [Burkholderiaceae bacterium]